MNNTIFFDGTKRLDAIKMLKEAGYPASTNVSNDKLQAFWEDRKSKASLEQEKNDNASSANTSNSAYLGATSKESNSNNSEGEISKSNDDNDEDDDFDADDHSRDSDGSEGEVEGSNVDKNNNDSPVEIDDTANTVDNTIKTSKTNDESSEKLKAMESDKKDILAQTRGFVNYQHAKDYLNSSAFARLGTEDQKELRAWVGKI